MKLKNIPIGIKIISIVYYIFALLYLFSFIVSFIVLFINTKDLFFIFIFILLLIALLITFFIFVGWGLWRLKSWARLSAIIFHFIVSFLFTIQIYLYKDFFVFILVLLNLAIAAYLLFSEEVKKVFEQ